MFCSACGKPIPEESKFCMYCGAPILGHADGSNLRATPPVALVIQGLWLIGPTEIKKGFLDTKVGRGFKWAISLLDSDNQETISDGKLIAVLRCGLGSQSAYGGKVYKATIQEARRVSTSSDALWHKVLDVNKDDFKFVTYTIRWSGAKSRHLVYEYSQTSPLLFFSHSMEVELHCWFITPDGRCIYKPIEYSTSWDA